MADDAMHSSVTVENLPTFSGSSERYLQKLSEINGIDPYSIPAHSWSKDLNRLPPVMYPDIFVYLVTTTSFYTGTQFKAYKGLSAYNQAYNGWVRDVKWFRPSDCAQVLLTAKVLHSQRLSEKPLTPWVSVKEDGAVSCAHCNCMAGAAEACTHVAALLFYVETAVRLHEKTTVTGEPAYWSLPSGLKKAGACRLTEVNFTNSKAQRKQHVESCSIKSPTPKKKPLILSEDSRQKFLKNISSLESKSVVLSVLPNFQDSFLPTKLYPVPLLSHKDTSLLAMPIDFIRDHCLKINLNLTLDEIKCVEKDTREQSNSKLWFRQREGRVTASEIYNVCHTSFDKPSMSLLQRIISPKPLCTKAVQWGKDMENTARLDYVNKNVVLHKDFVCSNNGLFLCQEFPFLAATPDGIISCSCCGKGCLEIKCPHSFRDYTICGAAREKNFCLETVNGQLVLKTNHPYFYQCQAQMFVTSTYYADFCVWTNLDLFVQRIEFDSSFFDNCLKKAKDFFNNIIFPEIVSEHFSKGRKRTEPSAEKKYCICNQHEFGDMILCDNKNCIKKWFHFPCVGISNAPRGKWFCDTCKSFNS